MSTYAARRYGPSALGGDLRRFVELTVTLARTEFKLRYFGSVLGYLWSLMRPLLFFGVIYVVFARVFSFGDGIPHYPVYLLTGIVLWTYFGEATSGCVQCLVQREALLRKIRFPRLVIPLAVSLTALFNLAVNFIAVLVFALADGVYPRISWLWMLAIVLGFMLLATGLGMLLSALYVRFRDIQPIWEVVVQALFYASPIMYVASRFKGAEHVALQSPPAMLLTQMGHSFVHPHKVWVLSQGRRSLQDPMRSAAAAAGGPIHLIIPLALIPAIFALGFWVFAREAPRVAENL